tara:strand:- start:3180 stop:3968 length:789 start_codon:yes stop_codon:yes gene_type:complete
MNNIKTNANKTTKIVHFRNKTSSNSLSLHGLSQKELRNNLKNSIISKNEESTQIYLSELQQMHKTALTKTLYDIMLYSSMVTQFGFIIWAWDIFKQIKNNKNENYKKQLLFTLTSKLTCFDIEENRTECVYKYIERNQILQYFDLHLNNKNEKELIRLINDIIFYEITHEKTYSLKNKTSYLIWNKILNYCKNFFINDNQILVVEILFELYKIFHKINKQYDLFMTRAINCIMGNGEIYIYDFNILSLTVINDIYSKRWRHL